MTGASGGLQYAGRWLLNIALANLLSTWAFGSTSTVLAIANLAMVVLSTGAPLHSYRIERERWRDELHASYRLLAWGAAALLPVAVGLGVALGYPHEAITGLLLAALYAFSQVQTYSLRSRGELRRDILLNVGCSAGFLLAPVLIWALGMRGSAGALWVLTGCTALGALPGFHLAEAGPRPAPSRLALTAASLRQRAVFCAGDLAAAAVANLPVLILASFASPEAAAIFRGNYGLLLPLLFVAVVLSQSGLVALSSPTATGETARRVTRRIFTLTSVGGVVGGLAYFALAPVLLPLIFAGNPEMADPGRELTLTLALLLPLWFMKSAAESLVSKMIGGNLRLLVNVGMTAVLLVGSLATPGMTPVAMTQILLVVTGAGTAVLTWALLRSLRPGSAQHAAA